MIEISCLAQLDSISENGFLIPNSLENSIQELDKLFTEKAKDKLISLNEDTIGYIHSILIFDEWLVSDSSRLKWYFISKGLRFEYEMEYFITLSYHRYLKTGDFEVSRELDNHINNLDSIRRADSLQCITNQLRDTLNGAYIPINLYDSYRVLDELFGDSLKAEIRNSSEMINFHFSIGIWLRNHWGLWNCSRLYKFFKENNIRHPDDMSYVIMEGYKHHLTDSTKYSINEAITHFSLPPPPPQAIGQEVKYTPPKLYIRKYNRFVRRRKIEDFEIGGYSGMK